MSGSSKARTGGESSEMRVTNPAPLNIPCRFPFCLDPDVGCFPECEAHLLATTKAPEPRKARKTK